jgi:ADP-ribose pyrophosphatase YjhB (NUDIX family)
MDKRHMREVISRQNRDISSIKIPFKRIKVRALVKCGSDYLFIRRTRPGKRFHYTTFSGGRVKNRDVPESDDRFDRQYLPIILEKALVRELQEELACQLIKVVDIMSISKVKEHDQEVLYYVEVGSYDWDKKTGKEFSNPNKGTYELLKLKSSEINSERLGKKDLRFKPKAWEKLLVEIFE